MYNKIFCIGDGYGNPGLWPQWTTMVELLNPESDTIIFSPAGAGPEIMVEYLLGLSHQIVNQTVIVQWSNPDRFDKLITDEAWLETITTDTNYKNNIVEVHGNDWWISSDSPSELIRNYHNNYVQKPQAQKRLQNWITLVNAYLKHNNAKYVDTSLESMYTYYKFGPHANLFHTNKIGGRQPEPIVHFDFVVEHLLPQLERHVTDNDILFLRNLIQDADWQPYNVDHNSVLVSEIKTKFRNFRNTINN